MKRLFYFVILLFSIAALTFPYQMITAGNSGAGNSGAVNSGNASTGLANSNKHSTASVSWSISFLDAPQSAKAILLSASGRMIEFRTQNGMTINDNDALKREIPSLVLYRNDGLTSAEERTAIFKVEGLPSILTPMTLTLQILTQHNDPDQGVNGDPILVAEKTLSIMPEETHEGIVITHTFGAQLDDEQGNLATPTDYLQVHVLVTDDQHSIENPLVGHVEEYALLLENQWVYKFSGLNEDESGAAPDELVVYYCDMFPFQKGAYNPSSRVHRSEVRSFIEDELGPHMASAVVTQTNLWGFPWSPEWTSYRGGEDSERLSVALTMPGEWFHGRAPGAAHSGITILTAHEDYKSYPSLGAAIMGVFHHELFHNVQRNINQAMGGDGNIDSTKQSWGYFTEGMAIMASSVGQPSVELNNEGSYLRQANSFLAGNKFEGDDLNTSYDDLNPYRGAFYWRFLYEECGGLSGKAENPANGMRIIRETLIRLYSPGENKPANLVELLPEIMDQALAATPSCPFKTYEESLTNFAKKIYALRNNTRVCAQCSKYSEPPAMVLGADGTGEGASGQLPASYGIDIVEINLNTHPGEQPVQISFTPVASTGSVFNVQMVRAKEGSQDGLEIMDSQTVEVQKSNREAPLYLDVGEETGDVALIITRVDADEVVDPQGAYTVSLR